MKNQIALFLFSLLLIGCTEHQSGSSLEKILIDVDSCVVLSLDIGKIVPLETTDSSLLYDIISIDQIEGKYFVRSRSKVLAFGTNGEFLYNVSGKGQGNKEYVGLSSFFIDNNELCFYDNMTRRILRFSPSGNYLRTEKVPVEKDQKCIPYLIYPLENGQYLAKNQFNGTPGATTPVLSILNDKYMVIEEIAERLGQTGFSLFDFANYNPSVGAVTYWEPLNDTIYSVKGNEIYPAFFVDFGKNAISEKDRMDKDIYDLIDYVNKPENDGYATFVRYVHEKDQFVYFIFSHEKRCVLAKYNRRNGQSIVYTLLSDKYKIASFLKIEGDEIMLVLEDKMNIENNQSLFVIDKNKLSDY